MDKTLIEQALEGAKPKPTLENETVIDPPERVTTKPNSAPATVNLADLNDEELEKEMVRRGKKVVAPEATTDTRTEAQKQQDLQKKKLDYGISKELFTLDQWNQYQVDSSRTSRDIVYAQFMEDNKESGKTHAILDTEFRALYYEDVEDDMSYLRDRRAQDIEREAKRILKNKYPKIHSLDREFTQHESSEQTAAQARQEQNQKREVAANNVRSVISTIKNQKFTVKEEDGKEESFDFEYPDNLIAEIQTQFLTDGALGHLLDSTPEDIKEVIETALLKKSQSHILSHLAKKYRGLKKNQDLIGRKHMDAQDNLPGDTVTTRDPAWDLLQNHPTMNGKEVPVS